MKLIDLIRCFKDSEMFNRLVIGQGYSSNTEDIQVYMENTYDIDSEIHLLPIEITNDDIHICRNGVDMLQLFSLDTGLEFYSQFREMFLARNYDEDKQAKRLLEYVINDA